MFTQGRTASAEARCCRLSSDGVGFVTATLGLWRVRPLKQLDLPRAGQRLQHGKTCPGRGVRLVVTEPRLLRSCRCCANTNRSRDLGAEYALEKHGFVDGARKLEPEANSVCAPAPLGPVARDEQREHVPKSVDSGTTPEASSGAQRTPERTGSSRRRQARAATLRVGQSTSAVPDSPLQTPLEETFVSVDNRLPVPNWEAKHPGGPGQAHMRETTSPSAKTRSSKSVRPARQRQLSNADQRLGPTSLNDAVHKLPQGSRRSLSTNPSAVVNARWERLQDSERTADDDGPSIREPDYSEDDPSDNEPLAWETYPETPRARSSESSTLRWYLRMIGRVDMLTPEEEVSLSRQISRLLHWERMRIELHGALDRAPTDDELAEHLGVDPERFRRNLAEARRAKDRMVAANLRLVVSIAKRYMRKGLPLEDLIQEGSLGLIRAAEKFDDRRGCRFSTYATWWVKQSVMRALADQGRIVRLPVHMHDRILAVRKAARDLSIERGCEPTEADICERLGISRKRLRELRSLAVQTISLESSVRFGNNQSGSERDRTTLADSIVHESASPEEQIELSMLREDLERSLQLLNHVEMRVVRLRYGLDSGIAKTIDEVGALVRLPREEVRAIENAAFRKLRHTSGLVGLKDYISSLNTSAL
jgi:RNA polymerase primary sigma factor